MAPAQRYPSAAKQMVELGRQARFEGLTFEAFWERAVRPGISPPVTPRRLPVIAPAPSEAGISTARLQQAVREGEIEVPYGAVIWPSDTTDRTDAIDAIISMKEVWRRCYENLPPTPADLAAIKLYAGLSATDVGGNDLGSEVVLATPL